MEKGIQKIALVGNGKIGSVHLNTLEKIKDITISAVIDPVNQQQKHPHYQNLTDFLKEDSETDFISIATPNGLHYQHIKSALNAGKNVLVEKPLTLNSDAAEELIHLAESQSLRLYVTKQLRFSPVVQFVQDLIKTKKLGEIYMVNVACYWNRNKDYYLNKKWHGTSELDGGVLYTQFSHFIDILHFWFNQIKVENANFYHFNHQDCTDFADSGKIDFTANEAKGNMMFTTSTYQKNFESSITILAEKGTVQIGDQYLNRFRYFNVDGLEIPTFEERKDFHLDLYHEILRSYKTKEASIIDASHGVQLIRFIEKAEELSKQEISCV